MTSCICDFFFTYMYVQHIFFSFYFQKLTCKCFGFYFKKLTYILDIVFFFLKNYMTYIYFVFHLKQFTYIHVRFYYFFKYLLYFGFFSQDFTCMRSSFKYNLVFDYWHTGNIIISSLSKVIKCLVNDYMFFFLRGWSRVLMCLVTMYCRKIINKLISSRIWVLNYVFVIIGQYWKVSSDFMTMVIVIWLIYCV